MELCHLGPQEASIIVSRPVENLQRPGLPSLGDWCLSAAWEPNLDRA